LTQPPQNPITPGTLLPDTMRVTELPLDDRAVKVILDQGIEELYPPQQDSSMAVLQGKNTVLAVPTASGKSLVAYLACVSAALRGGKCLYIVPLRALATEKYQELSAFRSLGLRIGISTGDLDSSDPRLEKFDILVVTSEKADSLFRHRVGWLKRVSVVVADEVHLIHDSGRGPTLEVTLARFRHLNPEAQIVALSATIANSRDLALWLDAEHFTSDWRPVELRRGVYLDGNISFEDGKTEEAPSGKGPVDCLIKRALEQGHQALVFVNTRRSTERTAEDLSPLVGRLSDDRSLEELKSLARGSIRGGEDVPVVTERLIKCLKGGSAFHHAGLTNDLRSFVEENFKKGLIRVIVATPTLAAGINLPARVVVVRDLHRFESGLGNVPLPVMEVHQMCGRAGRPRYDSMGEAFLLARTEDEKEGVMDHYIHGESEPILSKLGVESSLRTHVLSSIAMGLTTTEEELDEFIDNTFYGYQEEAWSLKGRMGTVLEYLETEGLVSTTSGLRATEFGQRTSQLYIDPVSAVILRDALKKAEVGKTDALMLLHAAASTPDMIPFFPRRSDHEMLGFIMKDRDGDFLVDDDEGSQSFMGQVKTAAVLEQWINEVHERTICERFDVYPGDLRNKADTARWLVYAMGELARIFNKDLSRELVRLSDRLEHGIREELLDLMAVKGVGRVRARHLFNAGYRKVKDLRKATPDELSRVPGIGRKLATEIIVLAGGHAEPLGGEEDEGPPSPPEGQSSLGDFGDEQ